MSFLIAIAVLVVTLVAAALIAPRPFHDLTFRADPCALELREWGVIDPQCDHMNIGRPSWTRRGDASQIVAWTDRPVN